MAARLKSIKVSPVFGDKMQGFPSKPAQGDAMEPFRFEFGNRVCWAVQAYDSDMADSTSTQLLAAQDGLRHPCGWLRIRDQTYLILLELDEDDGEAELPSAKDESWESLSERETQIAVLVSRGKGTKQIADRLLISEHTVRSYMRRIFSKLHVSTRPAMVAQLLKSGFVLTELAGRAPEKGSER